MLLLKVKITTTVKDKDNCIRSLSYWFFFVALVFLRDIKSAYFPNWQRLNPLRIILTLVMKMLCVCSVATFLLQKSRHLRMQLTNTLQKYVKSVMLKEKDEPQVILWEQHMCVETAHLNLDFICIWSAIKFITPFLITKTWTRKRKDDISFKIFLFVIWKYSNVFSMNLFCYIYIYYRLYIGNITLGLVTPQNTKSAITFERNF